MFVTDGSIYFFSLSLQLLQLFAFPAKKKKKNTVKTGFRLKQKNWDVVREVLHLGIMIECLLSLCFTSLSLSLSFSLFFLSLSFSFFLSLSLSLFLAYVTNATKILKETDGYTNRCVDKWTNGQMIGWINARQTERRTEWQIDRQIDWRVEGKIEAGMVDRQTDRQTGG